MKKILGLDIGSASIGWAYIHESEDTNQKTKIKKLGVRIIPMGSEKEEFESGNAITKNADRREKRGSRRNNQRYKLRKRLLIKKLKVMGMYPFSEFGNKLQEEVTKGQNNNFVIYELRDKALKEKLSLQEIGRIFYHLNQKRGYKSNRKTNIDDKEIKDTESYLGRIDSLNTKLETEEKTIGQYLFELFQKDIYAKVKENVFLREKFIEEFDKIWDFQNQFYTEILTERSYSEIRNEIIYYQRRLKSQKHLVSECQFEKHHKAVPKSSPIFQYFRTWQKINSLVVLDKFGKSIEFTIEQKKELFNKLNNVKGLSSSAILKMFNFRPRTDYALNFPKVEGNQTRAALLKVFGNMGIDNLSLLDFNPLAKKIDQQPLYKLWHLIYSIEQPKDLVKILITKYNFTEEEAKELSKINYKSDYGSLSAKAIRKLMSYLLQGLTYDKACDELHSEDENKNQQYINNANNSDNSKDFQFNKIELLKPNSLRNPVVEKVVNQVINLVNAIVEESDLGQPDEIRVELARWLKQNIKQRKKTFKNNSKRNRENEAIIKRLQTELKFRTVSRTDLQRYQLWEESNYQSIYTGEQITLSKLYDKALYDIEHIIPKSRYFDDSFMNKTICESKINREKGDMTANDYMKSKSKQEYHDYIERVNNNKNFYNKKKKYLRMPEEDIPKDFISRQLNETHYISKKVTEVLKKATPKVTTTTGSVTDFLRYNWGLNDILKQLNIDKYKDADLTEVKENKIGKSEDRIVNWSKRDDHRHHAIDALVVAFTKPSHINKLNRLSQFVRDQKELKEKARYIEPPIDQLTAKVKDKVDDILISFKKNNKVISRKINRIKHNGKEIKQVTYVPRGALHRDNYYGKIKQYKKLKINTRFEEVDKIVDPKLKQIILQRLSQFENNPKKAFKGLNKKPIWLDATKTKELNEVTIFEETYSIRKPLNTNFKQVKKIIDKKVKGLVKERLEQFGNKHEEAFKDLETNPIWLDKKKTIPIKSVKIFDHGTKLRSIHKNINGKPIDFVYERNNHHIAIYELENGTLEEEVVSLWDVVERKLNGSPIINKQPDNNKRFVTSMEINEMFVMNLDPTQIDFYNPTNFSLISKNLYRVQKLSSSFYTFRHHLETKIDKTIFPFEISIRSLSDGKSGWLTFKPIKVRIDNLNRIVKVGG